MKLPVFVFAFFLVAFSESIKAIPTFCICNGIINSKGQGECQTTYKGKHFCYVDQGMCEDEKKGSKSTRYWSYDACQVYSNSNDQCYSLSGERCQFPFKYKGKTFNNCTTYDSANNAAWCATQVKGSDRDAILSKLEDCSTPCDYGTSPYEKCPRNPVVKGLSKGCCTEELTCGLGEGDCDSDTECHKGLKCGDSNCGRFRPDNYYKADCCYDPYQSSGEYGNALCQYNGRSYDHDETFPASDSCNDCHCQKGKVTCTEQLCEQGSQCTTVGGPDAGAMCKFPFIFDRVRYNECTTKLSNNGKPWCSTKTDTAGVHIGGQGNWGHCPSQGCEGQRDSGTWLNWGAWSRCTQSRTTCEGGTQTRKRTCAGSGCIGVSEEVITCNVRDCRSIWANWEEWGACSESCGAGVQRRRRRCARGNCQGDTVDSRSCRGTKCSGCTNRRVRRNVNRLGTQERQKLVRAIQSAINRNEYQDVGNYHGSPVGLCGEIACCPHRTRINEFLPWHRLYMVQMEETLGEALPYWDWTEGSQVPDLWEGVQAPIKDGHQSFGGTACPRGDPKFVRRATAINIDSIRLKDQTRTAFMAEDFESFSSLINMPHNRLHVGVACDMEASETAAYDPIFYLHHSYVDWQFAFWQELQILRGHDVPNLSEHQISLEPFNNRQFNDKQRTLQNNRGRDTFDYKNNYCYEYDELTFDNMTPREFLASLRPSITTTTRRPAVTIPGTAESVPPPPEVPLFPNEIYIGVVLPNMAQSGIHTFELCQGRRCVEAGDVATFGSRNSNSVSNVDKSNHYIQEVDVTELVSTQNWVSGELTAMLTSNLLDNVPEPVVIRKFNGNTVGEVTIGAGQKLEDYGDLLEDYDIVEGLA